MSEATPDPSTHLEPPSMTTEREDPGAEDMGMHFKAPTRTNYFEY